MFKTNQTYKVTMLVGTGKSQRKIMEKGTYMGKVSAHPEIITHEFFRIAKKAKQKATFAVSQKLIESAIEV